jgi:hypothetical protein
MWGNADFVVVVETREPICTKKVLIVLTGNQNDFAHNVHAFKRLTAIDCYGYTKGV